MTVAARLRYILSDRFWAEAMKDRIEECARQATQARQSAEKDPALREEWLSVAAMWEELAAEYEKLAATREGTARKENQR